MKKKIYSEEHFNTSRWTGGTTTEFAIFPGDSHYIDRDFIWRISSARVEVEESTFTKLPDYDRILMVLDGEVVLAHGQERSVNLKALEQDSFSGDAGTKSFGKITDYNLMYRKGSQGRMELLTAEAEAKDIQLMSEVDYSHRSCGFYCVSGYGVVSAGGDTHMIKAGQQMIIDFEKNEAADMALMGDGQMIFTEIRYNIADLLGEEIPEEAATIGDFKMALKLVHSRYKWNEALRKNKDVWYDEALKKKLNKLERSYITFIIWIIMALIIVASGLKGISDTTMIAVLVIWTVLHMLVVSPLIYMMVLPKPISAHIKNINKLNQYEKDLYEKEQEENQAAEKVLKKYKNSGKKLD